MSTAVQTLESLQEALDPLSEFQNEQADLGSWIHDSFSALEKLHAELTQWQSELARKETELDLREDALSKSTVTDKGLEKKVAQLEKQLASATHDLQKREQEHGQKLLEIEALEARIAESEVRYAVANERVVELEAALVAERERAASECALWKKEFHNLRGELENHYQLIAEQVDKVAATAQPVGSESSTPLSAGAVRAKNELRRRALYRREARRN